MSGQNPRRRGQGGFTLLEFVVASVMSLTVSYFVYGIMIAQTEAYRRQDLVLRMEQNLRFSTEFVSRSVEMAGYGTNGWTVGDDSYSAVNVIDGGGTEPDAIQVLYGDPSRVAITPYATTFTCDATFLTFQTQEMAWYFMNADYMLCFNYSNTVSLDSYLFGVDSVNTDTGDVNITTPSGSADYDALCDENLPPDLMCAPASWHLYYIDNTDDDDGGPGRPDRPMLMMRQSTAPVDSGPVVPSRDDYPLAEGIEHMDVQVCMTGGDCFFESEWTETLNTAATDSLRLIRMTLWGRSERPAREQVASPWLNPLTGENDQYYRIASTTDMMVRNLRNMEGYN